MKMETLSKGLRWSSFVFFGGWLVSTFVLFDAFLGLSILLISLILIALSVLPKDRIMAERATLTKGNKLYKVAWIISIASIGSLIPWRLMIDEPFFGKYIVSSTFIWFVSIILVSAYHVVLTRSLPKNTINA